MRDPSRVLRLDLPPDAALRTPTIADVEALHELIRAEREHLSPWMPWAAQDLGATRAWVRDARLQAASGTAVQLVLEDAAGLAGCVGLYGVDRRNGTGGMGWWIGASRQGRGLATRAAAGLVAHAFDVLGLARLEIGIAPGNVRSRAVAERLGFVPEGLRREAERHPDGRRDLELLGLLARERDPGRIPRRASVAPEGG